MESVENGLKQKDQKKETETGEVQTRDVETGLGQDEKKNNDDEIVEEKTDTDLELDETKNNTENVEVKDQTNTTSETELKQDEPKNETSEGQEETPEETKPTETTVEEPKAAEPPANKQDSQWTSDDWYWWNSWKYDGWWNWGGDDKHDTQLWSVKRDKEPSTTPSTVTSSPSNTDLQSCLERANTVDLKNAVPEGTGEKENGKPEAKDDTEETKKAQLDKKEKDKKAAHARYMRYYRSVHESHDLIFWFWHLGVMVQLTWLTKHLTSEKPGTPCIIAKAQIHLKKSNGLLQRLQEDSWLIINEHVCGTRESFLWNFDLIYIWFKHETIPPVTQEQPCTHACMKLGCHVMVTGKVPGSTSRFVTKTGPKQQESGDGFFGRNCKPSLVLMSQLTS